MAVQNKKIAKIQSSATNQLASKSQRLDNAVCWYEGMLLSPHHFQQNQNYWEKQLRQLTSIVSPSFWGVGELLFDHGSLIEGEVSIERLIAVMPDGLLIDYDCTIDDPLTIVIDDLDENMSLTVQLVVPIQVPGSASERSEMQRYSSRDEPANIDENTGDNELVIPRLYPKLSLQIADRIGHRFVSLPLFRLIKPSGGSFQIDPGYCPPLLTIGADHFRANDVEGQGVRSLKKCCQDLAVSIRLKAHRLAGLSDDGDNLGHNITQRHHRWIRAMVQDLASFEQLADDACCKPSELYQGLIRMAGPISELDPCYIPPKFPRYFHDNALPGFQQLIQYISDQIDRVNLNFTTLTFSEDTPGVYTLNYDKAWDDRDLLIELRPQKDVSREHVIIWLDNCRIASANFHKELQERRMLGAKAQRIDADEKSGIVPGTGNALFRLSVSKKVVRPGSKLAIASSNKAHREYAPAVILLHMPHE